MRTQPTFKAWLKLIGIEKIYVGITSILLSVVLGYWLNGVFKPEVILGSLVFIILALVFSNLSYAKSLVNQHKISKAYLFAKGINLEKITVSKLNKAFLLVTIITIISFLLLLIISDVNIGSFFILSGFFFYFIGSNFIFSRGRSNNFDFLRLRELSIFLYLGIYGIMGNIYLYSSEFNVLSLTPALGFGFFVITIYNLDNIRASRLDAQYKDLTLATILSPADCKHFHAFSIILAFIFYISFTYYSMKLAESYLYLIVAPFFVYHLYKIYHSKSRYQFYLQTEFAKTLVATVNIAFMICVVYVSIYY